MCMCMLLLTSPFLPRCASTSPIYLFAEPSLLTASSAKNRAASPPLLPPCHQHANARHQHWQAATPPLP